MKIVYFCIGDFKATIERCLQEQGFPEQHPVNWKEAALFDAALVHGNFFAIFVVN